MNDLKRVSWIAITLIVLLRVSIGWQFLYEGMWKYDTLDSPKPWSAEGYLKSAQGPFRDYFRSMTGDPNDLNWLNYEKVSQQWANWQRQFASHYNLDEKQRAALNDMFNGSSKSLEDPSKVPAAQPVSQSLDQLPESVDLSRVKETVSYDEKGKKLIVKQPMLPSEQSRVLSQINVIEPTSKKYTTRDGKEADPVEVKFYQAFNRLTDLSRRLPYRQQLAAMLKGDPDRVGVVGRLNERGSFDIEMGTVSAEDETQAETNIRYGQIQEYKDLVNDYEKALDKAAISYQYDHANLLSRKLAMLRSEVVSPVKALDDEVKEKAMELLTKEQFARGPLPPENTPTHAASMKAMWGLLILGVLLICGLGTRVAALGGAFMLLNFYLVNPPFPGVPPAPGPEHALFINKNMIEIIALLAIAATPSGSWFGLDSIFSGLFLRKKNAEEETQAQSA